VGPEASAVALESTDGEVVGTRVARLPTRSSCLLSAASWPSRLQNGIGMPTTSTRARGSS
jgi:hypothetical protein